MLFAVIGLQYLGTALGDWHAARSIQRPVSNAPLSSDGMGGRDSSSDATLPSGSGQSGATTPSEVGNTSFYVASVWSRLVLVAAFSALVALGRCERGLLVLAAVNAAGAAGMWRALQQQQQKPA